MSLLFIKRFLSSPATIGSLIPSSKNLAKGISRNLGENHCEPKRYLEIGGGSGALTSAILEKINRSDQLDIVEMDSQLCALLRKKFGHLPNVTLYETSILNFERSNYDAIVSSLPLYSFKSTLVDQILTKYTRLVKPGGHLYYFEYVGFGNLKKACLFGERGSDFRKTLKLKQTFVKHHCEEVDHIWFNFPPARVLHCKITPFS